MQEYPTKKHDGSDSELKNLRIVVADDDNRMRQFYETVLTLLGHEVVESAANGVGLVEACLVSQVDLVVTDIRMPELDGVSAAHIVTRQKELPFVFVSAYYDETLIETVSREFSYGYLVKPIAEHDLATTIPIAMRRFRER